MTIEAANAFAVEWMDALWRATWEGALAVAAVWLVCLCFRRLPHSARNALWWLVCAKMLVALAPVSLNVPLPTGSSEPTYVAPISASPPAAQRFAYSVPVRFEPPKPQTIRSAAPKTAPLAPAWQLYLIGAWMLGAAACALVSLTALARARRIGRRAAACMDPSMLQAASGAAARAGLRRAPAIRVTSESKDVLTLGFVRPAVLMPKSVVENCSTGELDAILAHECAHIRRGDPQMGLVPQAAQIVFYFHPLVWLATREYTLARESACDQAAMAAAQIGPNQYGRLLLSLGARKDRGRTLCLPGVSSHFHLLRRRISMLDRISHQPVFQPKRSVAAALSLTALLFVLPLSLVQGRTTETATAHKTVSHAKRAASLHKAAKIVKVAKLHMKPTLLQPFDFTTAGTKASTTSAGLTTTVFSLQYAKAADATATLEHLYKSPDLAIIADARTNAVLIHGTKAEISEVTGVLTNLDQPSLQVANATVQRPTTLYRLQYAKAEDVAGVLRSTVATRGAVSLGVDTRTNSLVVIANERTMPTISNLIRQLDIPASDKILRRIGVHFMKADELLKMIGPHLPAQEDYEITVDPRDNSLVVTGSEDEVNRIQTVVQVFDFKQN